MSRLHVGLLLSITLTCLCLYPIHITAQNTTTHVPTNTSTPTSSNVTGTTQPPTSIPSYQYQCVTLPSSSICSSVLSYSQVLIPLGTCIDAIESRIHDAYSLFWSTLSTTCRPHLASYMCQQAYSPCQSCGSVASTCASAVGNCSLVEKFQHQLLTEATDMISADTCAALPPPRANCTAEPADFTPTPMYPRCEPYRGTICQGVLSSSYSVYVPAKFTQEGMEAMLSMTTKLWGTANVANGCLDSAARYLCTTTFPRCDPGVLASVGVSAPFPRFPCRSVCEEFTNRCADSMLSYIPEDMRPNCTSQGTIAPAATVVCGVEVAPALDDYPITSSNFGTLLGMPLLTQCNTLTSSEIAAQSTHVMCPSPLVIEIVTDLDQIPIFPGGTCATPCNGHSVLTNQEWDSLGQFCIALSVISFVLGSFLFWTWLCIPSKRKQRNTLFFNLCVMILSFVVLLGYIINKDPKNVGCKSPAQAYLQPDGGFCVFQAVTVYYFAFAAIWWWSIISIDLFIAIVILPRRTDRDTVMLSRIYHSLAWGVPCLGTIILLSRKQFGGSTIQTFCWIGALNEGWEVWAFFVIPFAILTFIGFAAIITIMLVMARSASNMNSRLRRDWKKYVRPILFMIQFGVLFIIVFGFYLIHLHIKKAEIMASGEEFFTCILSPEGSQQSCGTDGRPSLRPTLSWVFAVHFAICGQGLVNFITYGTQWSNFVEWKKLIIALFTGRAISYQTSGDAGGYSGTKAESTARDSKHDNKLTRDRSYVSDQSNPASPSPRNGSIATKPTSNDKKHSGIERSQRFTVSTTHTHIHTMRAATGTGIELIPGRMRGEYIDHPTPRVSAGCADETGFIPQTVDEFAVSTPRSPRDDVASTPSFAPHDHDHNRALLDLNSNVPGSFPSPSPRGASSSTSFVYSAAGGADGTAPAPAPAPAPLPLSSRQQQYVNNQVAILDELAYQVQQARTASITRPNTIPPLPPLPSASASRGSSSKRASSAANFV